MKLEKQILSTVIFLLLVSTVTYAETQSTTIDFPKGTSVEVLSSADGDFLGIGAITVENIVLSSSTRPMKIEVAGRDDKYDVRHKPQPLKYKRQKLAGIDKKSSTTIVNVDLKHADGSTDKLQIIFEFVKEKFYESDAVGLRYHFKWSSDKRYAHQVRETSWWTFGDSVDGLRWISQNGGYGRGSCDFIVKKGMRFGGYKLAGVSESPDEITKAFQKAKKEKNPIQFGYLPHKHSRDTRQGDGSFVTFACRDNVSFLRYADTPTQNYWEFEHLPNEHEVRFEEWYCVPMARKLATAPIVVEVLSKAGVNAWIDSIEIVKSKLLKAADMPRQEPLPWVAFHPHNIFDPYEKEKYGKYLENMDAAGELERRKKTELPYDECLAIMQKCGIKEYWWYGPWISAFTEVGKMTPEQLKKASPIYSAGVWDLKFAYSMYDVHEIKKLMIKSRRVGIEPIIWLSQIMSQSSPYVTEHPDWFCRMPDGSLYNYCYDWVFIVYHGGAYKDFVVSRISDSLKELPFNNLWLDSFCLVADSLDWMDPDLKPHMPEALKSVKRYRANGVKRVYCETNSPFLLSSTCGMLPPEQFHAGKNLYLLYDTALCNHDELSGEVYFKNLAFKSCINPYLKSYKDRPDFAPLASYGNKAYIKALPNMKKCVVLDDNKGTLYFNKDRSKAVVFSFVEDSIDIGRAIISAKEVLRRTPAQITGSKLSAKPYKVYLLECKK